MFVETAVRSGLVQAEQTDEPSASLPILPYWPELVFGLVVFGIFYWIVKTKVVPRLEEVYAERTAAIEGGMEQAEAAQQQAEEAKALLAAVPEGSVRRALEAFAEVVATRSA